MQTFQISGNKSIVINKFILHCFFLSILLEK